MNLNIDCVRDVLLFVENAEFGRDVNGSNFLAAYPNYTNDDFSYTCLKLKEAKYLEVVTKSMHPRPSVIKVKDITFEGHQFLADIKSDTFWNKIKDKASKVGFDTVKSLSVTAINLIATSLM
ncbi:MAG: DUF2513 domain-containing protein [Anaerostipes sp.]|jgi:hypothetical protein|nr:DUF2513 domain-containing protein [Anaerostipes sp.]